MAAGAGEVAIADGARKELAAEQRKDKHREDEEEREVARLRHGRRHRPQDLPQPSEGAGELEGADEAQRAEGRQVDAAARAREVD